MNNNEANEEKKIAALNGIKCTLNEDSTFCVVVMSLLYCGYEFFSHLLGIKTLCTNKLKKCD